MSETATLTIFAIPKKFDGHIGVIQRNAIRSWSKLAGVRILLLGNEPGTAALAEEIGAAHIPKIECNEYGTPYVASCFALAAAQYPTDLLAYVNADIILMHDFIRAVNRVLQHPRPFLMAGRRTDLELSEQLEFDDGWNLTLANRAKREGLLYDPEAIDYFVFRPDLFPNIPPFAIGRWIWDNWLLYEACRLGATLIDATPSVVVVHQNHEYDHVGDSKKPTQTGPEARANKALAPDPKRWYNLHHATRILYPWGLCVAWSPTRLWIRTTLWRRDHLPGFIRIWHAFNSRNRTP